MQTSDFVAVHAVLSERGVRAAARRLGRAPASVTAALARFEEASSIALAKRAGRDLVLTLEAQRILPDVAAAAAAVERLARLPGAPEPEDARRAAARAGVALAGLARLAAVVEAGGIRRAAANLGVGQPQLTRQLAHLERTFGVALIERGPSGCRPTEAGRAALEVQATLQAVWGRLARASARRFGRARAAVRLGAVMPLGHRSPLARRLAALAAAWLGERPRQPLAMASATAEELLAGLESGAFDVALLDTLDPPAAVESALVERTPLAFVHAGDPAAELATLVAERPLAAPSLRSGLRQRVSQLLADRLGEAARDALGVVEVDSIPVIANLVVDHGFVAVLPRASAERLAEGLSIVPLPQDYDLPLWIAWRPTEAGRRAGEAVLARLGAAATREDAPCARGAAG